MKTKRPRNRAHDHYMDDAHKIAAVLVLVMFAAWFVTPYL